jgi:glutamyl/glutaminyl-tRNA synthetase
MKKQLTPYLNDKLIKTRFAPTPSGYLHAGNGISFIITWVLAKAYNGKIVLRIDDLDAERLRLEYVEDIFKTIDWLGLDYDEGPQSVDDFFKNYSQHTRLDLYNDALKRLSTEGVLYACNCSRKKIKEVTINGLYPNICRKEKRPFDAPETAWRICVEDETIIKVKDIEQGDVYINLSATVGDFIVKQKNGLPAYQLASLVDDAYFNINFIVRGMDLITSTAAQLYLAHILHNDTFKQTAFFHHALIKGENGEKLSKSQGATALKSERIAGHTPSVLYQKAANWLGLSGDAACLQDVLEMFKNS